MVHALVAGGQLPSRRTLQRIIEKKYASVFDSLKDKLMTTADVWTGFHNKRSFMIKFWNLLAVMTPVVVGLDILQGKENTILGQHQHQELLKSRLRTCSCPVEGQLQELHQQYCDFFSFEHV
ncbi:unnamed protein product [Lepeophtheirus salmonis]|uniref:(salmon louse) hypothetical protein n=1 Tax=Lepeophtheirus salmonis TaxID=72036 RepID=A0A7R8CRM4_LEPSM|nr:unnamed protein product [Lepeophtheirus salmonis]CAF2869512.1 unnamed protein product [Lepeophtheirus salmonis]